MAEDLPVEISQSERAENSAAPLVEAAPIYDFNPEARPPLIEPNSWLRKTGQTGSLFESFFHAFHGLSIGFRMQRNVRIHSALALVVFSLAGYFRIEPWQWIALTLSIGFVFFAEYVNTAIEHMVDIQANYRYHLSARYAKDTAAGAVVIAALTAVIVGAIIFLPRILSLLKVTL